MVETMFYKARTDLEVLGVERIKGLSQAGGCHHAVAANLLLLRLEGRKQVCQGRHHCVALRSTVATQCLTLFLSEQNEPDIPCMHGCLTCCAVYLHTLELADSVYAQLPSLRETFPRGIFRGVQAA